MNFSDNFDFFMNFKFSLQLLRSLTQLPLLFVSFRQRLSQPDLHLFHVNTTPAEAAEDKWFGEEADNFDNLTATFLRLRIDCKASR